MAYAQHFRITALGRLGASAERFSYGLNMASGEVSWNSGTAWSYWLDPNNDVITDIAADLVAFHGHPDTQISPRAVLEEVKFAYIGTDGKYVQDAVVVNVADTPGGSLESAAAIATIPPQSAVAISLTTARRGATGRGRFYIPMSPQPLDANTLLMGDNQRDRIKTQTQTPLNDLNNQPGIDLLDMRVVVASSKGYNSVVTGVRCGLALDTIRSRRRSLPESYDAVLPVG